VSHGEHPLDTVVRETAAETGLSVAVAGLRDVLADMRALPNRGVTIHTDRLIYSVTVRGGGLRDRIGQPTDLARWIVPEDAKALPLRPFTATDRPVSAAVSRTTVSNGCSPWATAPPGRDHTPGVPLLGAARTSSTRPSPSVQTP